MHALIEARRQEIEALCRGLGIRRLDVFGSAVGNSFDVDTSDVDVLVEFDAAISQFQHAHAQHTCLAFCAASATNPASSIALNPSMRCGSSPRRSTSFIST